MYETNCMFQYEHKGFTLTFLHIVWEMLEFLIKSFRPSSQFSYISPSIISFKFVHIFIPFNKPAVVLEYETQSRFINTLCIYTLSIPFPK